MAARCGRCGRAPAAPHCCCWSAPACPCRTSSSRTHGTSGGGWVQRQSALGRTESIAALGGCNATSQGCAEPACCAFPSHGQRSAQPGFDPWPCCPPTTVVAQAEGSGALGGYAVLPSPGAPHMYLSPHGDTACSAADQPAGTAAVPDLAPLAAPTQHGTARRGWSSRVLRCAALCTARARPAGPLGPASQG